MRLLKKTFSLINLSFVDNLFDAKASPACEKSTQQIHLFPHIFRLTFF